MTQFRQANGPAPYDLPTCAVAHRSLLPVTTSLQCADWSFQVVSEATTVVQPNLQRPGSPDTPCALACQQTQARATFSAVEHVHHTMATVMQLHHCQHGAHRWYLLRMHLPTQHRYLLRMHLPTQHKHAAAMALLTLSTSIAFVAVVTISPPRSRKSAGPVKARCTLRPCSTTR